MISACRKGGSSRLNRHMITVLKTTDAYSGKYKAHRRKNRIPTSRTAQQWKCDATDLVYKRRRFNVEEKYP